MARLSPYCSSRHSLQIQSSIFFIFCCSLFKIFSMLSGCLSVVISRMWLELVLELWIVGLIDFVTVVCYNISSGHRACCFLLSILFHYCFLFRSALIAWGHRLVRPFSRRVTLLSFDISFLSISFCVESCVNRSAFLCRPFHFPFRRAPSTRHFTPIRFVSFSLLACLLRPFHSRFCCAPFVWRSPFCSLLNLALFARPPSSVFLF